MFLFIASWKIHIVNDKFLEIVEKVTGFFRIIAFH